MRSLVTTGLAVLAVAHAAVAYADPSSPQISPRHGRHEDAQRLREQLRGLDRETAPEPVAALALQPRTTVDPARGHGSAHDTPLARRWWFWAAVGAVAVTTFGLTYAIRSSESHLSGVTCDASGCHP